MYHDPEVYYATDESRQAFVRQSLERFQVDRSGNPDTSPLRIRRLSSTVRSRDILTAIQRSEKRRSHGR